MTDFGVFRTIAAICMDLASAYVVLSITYFLLLLLVAAAAGLLGRKRWADEQPITRFCMLIPAHNEELVISHTLSSVSALRYPPDRLKVYVIADNCTDSTAEISSKFDSVKVLVRNAVDQKSKGYALNWAIDQLKNDIDIDTFVIIDADTSIDPEFLTAMDRSRRAHESGHFVAQGKYGVANPNESWRTALMAGALSLVHVVRPLARELLHLSVGLKGNGMCIDRPVLDLLPWRGDSLTEDIYYTLDLLEKHDLLVHFVPSAVVEALMPTTAAGAASQRKRWEGGRSSILSRRAGGILWQGIIQLKPSYIDAAIDLLAPPLAQLAAALFCMISLIALASTVGVSVRIQEYLAGYSILAFGAYVLGGFLVGGAPPLAYKALLYAPFFALWKAAIRLQSKGHADGEWIRTAREQSIVSAVADDNSNDNSGNPPILTKSAESKN